MTKHSPDSILVRWPSASAALRSTSDFVAEALREAIVSGQLPAATELKQDAIAA